MEKRIKRASVDITIGSKDGSPLKDFPNIENLAMKYGVTSGTTSVNDEKGNNASNNNPSTQLAESSLILAREKEIEYQQKIEEKNKRIEQLCIMLEALEITPGVDPQKIQKLINEGLDENADFRDSKIVSLAKKSHKLTMQLNKEKSVNDKLNIQLSDTQKTIETLNQELQTAKLLASNRSDTKSYNRNADTSGADHVATIAGLSRDLKETNKVVDDLKTKLNQSVEESKKLSRALTRELGEGVSLDQAVDGGWRGRAQQIIMLKAKIKKLESGQSVESGVVSSGYGTKSVNSGAAAISKTGAPDVDRKAEEDIAAMSNDRRQIVEMLTEERLSLMEQNQQLEKKTIGQKARIQSLEIDMRRLKESLQVAVEKSSTDDELLDALRGQIEQLKSEVKAVKSNSSPNKHASISATYFNGSVVGDTITSHVQSLKHGKEGRQQSSMDDSLDFSVSRSSNEQLLQMQTELQRLKRLCKAQSEQLDTQDVTIRQLKKKLNPGY